MKLFTAIATAAVLGTALTGLPPANALSLSTGDCIGRATKAISSAKHGNWSRWSDYKIDAQTICHYAMQAGGSDQSALSVGIQKAGLSGQLSASNVLAATLNAPSSGGSRHSAPSSTRQPASEYRQPAYIPPQRSNTNISASSSSSRCPAGKSYHKIRTGGLLIKRTIAEGCFTPYEAAQLKMQADGIEQNRRANVMRNINANRQRQCFGSATSYGNYTFGNATCY